MASAAAACLRVPLSWQKNESRNPSMQGFILTTNTTDQGLSQNHSCVATVSELINLRCSGICVQMDRLIHIDFLCGGSEESETPVVTSIPQFVSFNGSSDHNSHRTLCKWHQRLWISKTPSFCIHSTKSYVVPGVRQGTTPESWTNFKDAVPNTSALQKQRHVLTPECRPDFGDTGSLFLCKNKASLWLIMSSVWVLRFSMSQDTGESYLEEDSMWRTHNFPWRTSPQCSEIPTHRDDWICFLFCVMNKN